MESFDMESLGFGLHAKYGAAPDSSVARKSNEEARRNLRAPEESGAAPYFDASSARYCGSMRRQVGQSWSHSPPHSSTRLGMPFEPSRSAVLHDSRGLSQRPVPCASTTKRLRSRSRCAPPSISRKNISG